MTESALYYAPFVRNEQLRKTISGTKELAAFESEHEKLVKIMSALAAAEDRVQKLLAKTNRPRAQSVADAVMLHGPDIIETMSQRGPDLEDLSKQQRERNYLLLAQEGQRAKLLKMERSLSTRILEAAQPAYAALVKQMAIAAVQLAKSQDAVKRFRRNFEDQSVTLVEHILRPCEPTNLFVEEWDGGTPTRLSLFLAEVNEYHGVKVAA